MKIIFILPLKSTKQRRFIFKINSVRDPSISGYGFLVKTRVFGIFPFQKKKNKKHRRAFESNISSQRRRSQSSLITTYYYNNITAVLFTGTTWKTTK